MPKKRKITPKRSPSKQELSKWQRQKRMQRYTVVIGGLVIVSILSIIGFGYYDNEFKPAREEAAILNQPALMVNNKVFSNEYLLRLLTFQSQAMERSLSNQTLDIAIDYIQEAETIKQEAEKINITISNETIDEEIKKIFAPTSLPDKNNEADFKKQYKLYLERLGMEDEEYRDLIRANLLEEKVIEDYISPKVPVEETHVQVERILLSYEEKAREVIDELKAGTSFASLVQDLSQDELSKKSSGNMGWLIKGRMSDAFDETAFKLKKGELSELVFDETVSVAGGYWLIKVNEIFPETVQASGILLRTDEEAQQTKARIEKGEDFSSLAKELSQDEISKSNNGDLGWLTEGELSDAFNEAVFALNKDEVSKPFFDDTYNGVAGYWVVKVTDKLGERISGKNILLRTEEEAQQAKARIEKGEVFSSLAEELSIYIYFKDDAGELHKLNKGVFSPEFDEIVFNLEPGEVGGPIIEKEKRLLKGGYWVIRAVEDPELKTLEENVLESRKFEAFNNWLDEKKAEYRLDNYLDEERKAWLLIKATQAVESMRVKTQ